MLRVAVASLIAIGALAACGQNDDGSSDEEAVAAISPSDGGEESPAAGGPDQLAVEAVYEDLAQAITRPGQVFHTRVTTSDPQLSMIIDVWVDLEQEVARRELRIAPNLDAPVADKTHVVVDGSFTNLLVGGGLYQTPVQICPGTASALLSLIVDCYRVGPYNEPFVYRTEPDATFEGSDAVLVVVRSPQPTPAPFPGQRSPPPGALPPGTPQGERSIDNWLFLDRATYLPLAKLAGTGHGDRPPDRPLRSTYENEFVARDSLSAGFFDPATLDPVDPSPVFREES